MTLWYQQTEAEVLQQLNTSAADGLATPEVDRRLAEHGPNELIDRGTKNPWLILWEQLTAVMVVILIIAAVISAFLGEYLDATAIIIIVILNAILGFTQEYRAEKAMAALKKLAVPTVKVRRNGHIVEVSARDLVPGDVVLLEAGGKVPADGRLIECANLQVQEAALTGESAPVEKHLDVLTGENIALGDRRNMVYMGTVVTYGRGTAVITATGMNTELGHIADMIQTVEREPTPLQIRLEQLGRGLAIAALFIVAVVFTMGVLRGEDLKLMFLTAISMAVAAVPEGLPAVVTIALALGAQRMLKRRALIRKLPAVETLGSVTVICSDKTGTLTENRMTVTVLDVAGDTFSLTEETRDGRPVWSTEEPERDAELTPSMRLLLSGAALCNDAVLEEVENDGGEMRIIGDPTEGALVIAATEFGLNKTQLEQRLPRLAEAPFTSERKRMSTVHRLTPEIAPAWLPDVIRNAPLLVFCKGATDNMLEVTDQVWINGELHPLDATVRERIETANNRLAQNGMRVLSLAFRPLDAIPTKNIETALEHNLIFVGLMGMIDPPRAEVKEAVKTCLTAGIRPVMITGDHPLTALHIAKSLNIAAEGSTVLTGNDLNRMSAEELEAAVETTSVYARVSPEHKLKIVEALQNRGHVAAMTGDGVNDAPALKKADIGVAMGITGTDVSKEASDMVLLNDNFATIVAAVEEGRAIYDNIRKFIKYALGSNTGEIWVMFIAPFLSMPLPLLPLQILWINLVTDGLPGLALTIEPAEKGTMRRPPHPPQENIFAQGLWQHIVWVGLLMGAVSLGMGLWAYLDGHHAWQTMVFNTLTLSQMGHVMAIHSGKESLFSVGLLYNKLLLAAVVLTTVLQMLVIYTPFFQNIFETHALSLGELAISMALSTVVFWAVEVEKWWQRRQEAAAKA